MLCKKFIEFLSVTNDLGSFLESDNAGLVRIPGIMMHSNDHIVLPSKPPAVLILV